MKGIALTLAKVALTKYLVKGDNEAKAWKWLEGQYGDDAAHIWKSTTGKNPPKPPAPAKEVKPAPAPAAKPKKEPKPEPVVVEEEAEEIATPAASATDDFAGITTFRNSANCRDWPVTVTISDVTVRGGNIAWKEEPGQREARGWNKFTSKGKSINGETILVIPSIKSAGMFDYLKVGQKDKILSNLYDSSHGKGFFSPWLPKKGERVGFCIATISRNKAHAKMKERSNVVWITWPKDF